GLSMSTRFLTAGGVGAPGKKYVVDATDQGLWRIATKTTTLFNGENKTPYTPFFFCGDHLIIVYSHKLKLTGEKLDKKVYRWHTLYPGGLREVAARKVFETRPEKMVREAVLGMLPKNKLRKRMVRRLKIYAADQHPHAAQTPETIKL